MGMGEQRKDHVNLEEGDADVEVLVGPPGGPPVHQLLEWHRMKDFVKDLKCILLRFLGMEAQHLDERLKVRVPKR